MQKIRVQREALDAMKILIRRQMVSVHKAELELEAARKALNEVMQERKMHEKLKEKAFEEFKKELLKEESKEIDGLVSYTYNAR
jgi:flagellar FliJ protein